MTDNIDRIQQKTQNVSIVLLAADILRLKDSIDALSELTKAIGEATWINLEALKEITEILINNDFCRSEEALIEPNELSLEERFKVWCDVTRNLQQNFSKCQTTQATLTTFMDDEFKIVHKELDGFKELIETLMNVIVTEPKFEARLLTALQDKIDSGDVVTKLIVVMSLFRSTGMSQTEIVVSALADYLGSTQDIPVVHRLSILERKVTMLEHKEARKND